ISPAAQAEASAVSIRVTPASRAACRTARARASSRSGAVERRIPPIASGRGGRDAAMPAIIGAGGRLCLRRRPVRTAAAVGLGVQEQTVLHDVRELARRVAPAPVATRTAGQVHARLAPLPEHVLHRRDGQLGYGGKDGADEIPVDLLAVGVHVAAGGRGVSLVLLPASRD